MDLPLDVDWDTKPHRATRFASPTLAAGFLVLVLGALVVLGAAIVPLFMRGGAQATARPRPLNPPTALEARGACDGFFKSKVTVTWVPTSSSIVDGYAIYRSTSADGPFRKVELLDDRTTTAWVDAGLDTGTRYFYAIRSTAGVRSSAYSGLAETHTPSFCL